MGPGLLLGGDPGRTQEALEREVWRPCGRQVTGPGGTQRGVGPLQWISNENGEWIGDNGSQQKRLGGSGGPRQRSRHHRLREQRGTLHRQSFRRDDPHHRGSTPVPSTTRRQLVWSSLVKQQPLNIGINSPVRQPWSWRGLEPRTE
ncbi:hypothetical protein EYF80_047614 [Liparis tanakae]|uniref:Uncharacterized protein n=1 Tax=Liparis tanakae TaxID=230148 RepID=A0A4Z2FM58_9TELE|nr:hypothetical protein EYF80_047614 [Liparis tanakae]